MATITQVLPFADSVVSNSSDGYVNQLNVTGSIGTAVFEAVNPPSALSISSSGAVTTTGRLTIGTYEIFGNVTDEHGNSGTWLFTLTTVGAISPQVSVVPVIASPPTGVEILVPFQIDSATGGVAVLNGYVQILEQHIATIIMTAQQERVMLPTYGVGLERSVFSTQADVTRNLLASDIQNKIQAWEPAVKVQSVNLAVSPMDPSVLTIDVEFTVVPFNDVSRVTVTTGGNIVQVLSP